MTKNHRGTLFLLGAALLWSMGGVLIKSVSWHPLAIAGTRSAIAACIFLLYLQRPRFSFSFIQVGGALSYTGTVALFVLATKLTTAANAIILQYSAPVYVALLAGPLLGEKTERKDFLAIGMVFSGMSLFFFDQFRWGNMVGNLLAIASGWTFALLAIFLRLQKDASPFESVLLGNLFTALLGLPFAFHTLPGAGSFFPLLLLGVFQIGTSYLLYVEATKVVTAFEACLIPIIEPILNPVWVFLFLGERPGPWALLGGGVILTAILWWTLPRAD